MTNTLINCRGRLIDLSQPAIMGILNVTPDSFFDGGKFNEEKHRRNHVEKMINDGALFIDIGGATSKPGSKPVAAEEEWRRVLPALKMMASQFPETTVSIDTYHPEVANNAFKEGASIINDITAGRNEKMFEIAAANSMPYIMMHMQGNPQTMQENPLYENVTSEVIQFFVTRIEKARHAGIKDIIIDPGFGFGKTNEHNFQLLKELSHFSILGLPIMAGLSRKSMINRTLDIKAVDALNGTTVLNTVALMNGAKILRVHDVREAAEAIKLLQSLNNI
jgi:dihydropteroate synthase